ncbi:type I methionyl aminopeptidase [Candidatus Microgenomates bacterium]|nr:MAG: type I methionyl aminopeptidase [Candidatus Microgenomates bacterium]
MINIKTKKEIIKMKEGGKILADVLSKLIANTKEGLSGVELDKLAEDLIIKRGALPGFKKVKGYSHTLCISLNDVVVHGIPSDYHFKSGDLVGIDCGVFYKGFFTDAAQTVRIKNQELGIKDKAVDQFLETGKRALNEAIKEAKIGNRIGDISKIIQNIVEGEGYSVVRSLVGHGVGKNLHEEPEVPGFLNVSLNRTPLLKEGMVIAIEVIYNMGKSEVVYAGGDGWSIKTKDGSLSSTFEKTVAITQNGPLVLT